MLNPFEDPKEFLITLWKRGHTKEAISSSLRDVPRILLKPRTFFQTEVIDEELVRPLIFICHMLFISGLIEALYALLQLKFFSFLFTVIVGLPIRMLVGVIAALVLAMIVHMAASLLNVSRKFSTPWTIIGATFAVLPLSAVLAIPYMGIGLWLPPMTMLVGAWIVAHGLNHYFDVDYKKALSVIVLLATIVALSTIYNRLQMSSDSGSRELGRAERDFLNSLGK